MKVTTFAKAGVSFSAAAALALGVCTSAFAAGPTATEEDPTGTPAVTTLVGAGSDTTQDVMYGIAQAINAGQAVPQIASYTATGTAAISWRSGKTPPPPRPNGSGAGYTALKDSIGYTSTGVYGVGDVDFARASGTQGTAVTGGNGVSTDIPFAVDTMSFAVPAGSPFLATNSGAGLSITDVYNIYAGNVTYIHKTTGALVNTATGSADTANYKPINAFVPKSGSGSRQFFLAQLATQGGGISLTANSSTKGDGLWNDAGTPTGTAPYIGAVNYGSTTAVQEHDATVLTTAPAAVAAIAPFSGAKFIGYADGKIADPDTNKVAGTDYKLVPFKSSVSNSAVLPYTGTGTSLVPNPAYVTNAKQGGTEPTFALTRDVFNIIPTAAVKYPTANAKFALLNKTFVGATSDVCKQTAAIAAFGFLPNSSCGDTSKTYDAMTSTPTVTVTAPASATAAQPAVFNVSVQSSGNGGGTVSITVAGSTFTGTVAPGATSGTVSVTIPAAGTYNYTGSFVPNLGGVAAAPITPGSLTVAAAPVVVPVKVNGTVKATAKKVKHTKKAKVAVAVTAAGVVPTGKVTVVIKKGATTKVKVANKTLVGGKVTVTLPKKLKKGSYKVFVSFTGDARVNAAPAKSVTTLKVS